MDTRICVNCNTAYTPHHSQQKYCGAKCSLEMKMRQNKECDARRGVKLEKKPKVYAQRNCLVCKELFRPRRAHQKYCCTACSRKADSDNKKAWYAKLKTAAQSTEPVPVPANLPSDSEFAVGKQQKCTLCNHTVKVCKCKCTWCGAPKWYVNGWNEWAHHVHSFKKSVVYA